VNRVEVIGDATLYLGDALEILPTITGVDAFLLDPPYSSGGQFRGDRTAKTSAKYIQTGSEFTCRVEFAGDNRDQRAFLAWSALWFGYMLKASNPGATVCAFTDWRQLPTMTDAIQAGGWVWRNLVTWWKPGIRMQRGRFSSSSEYIVYASNGVPIEGERSPQNVLQYAPVGGDDKEHIAEKPVRLLHDLLGVTLPDGVVCDPFMGGGSTGVACVQTGRRFIGLEIDPFHFETALRRIEQAQRQRDLFIHAASVPIDPAEQRCLEFFREPELCP
jgi:site-specific DNA-methyltransferase (adenine-specific)